MARISGSRMTRSLERPPRIAMTGDARRLDDETLDVRREELSRYDPKHLVSSPIARWSALACSFHAAPHSTLFAPWNRQALMGRGDAAVRFLPVTVRL